MFMDKLKLMPVGLQRAYDPAFLSALKTSGFISSLHNYMSQFLVKYTHTHTQSPTGSAPQIEP